MSRLALGRFKHAQGLYFATFIQVAGILTSARTILNAGSLTVWNLDVSDQGVYECVASNVIGDVITSTLLVVERQWFSRVFLVCR